MKKYRKILIISMNPLDNKLNNGKTLVSFFKKYPKDCLAQLYFSEMLPDSNICDKYFKISDMDMLYYRLKKTPVCGSEISRTAEWTKENDRIKNVKKTSFKRLIREALWNDSWKSKALFEWLDEFRPEIIFFVAGDVVYSHKICLYVRKKYNAKLVTFVTDDYVLPRKTLSLFWWVRRNYVLKYMRKTVGESEKFITISEDMRKIYYNFFKKDSYVAVNMTNSMKMNIKNLEKSHIEFVYTGGLHLGRDKILKKLALALKKINKEYNLNTKLLIYSGQHLSQKEISRLNVDNVSLFKGVVEGEELKKVLNNADFLVHVESFNKNYRYSTKLSLSTKIPEYLSVGKPILAIGPEEIASMRYLKDVAICINAPKRLEQKLSQVLISDKKELEKYGRLAEQKYNDNHSGESKMNEFMELLEAL